MRKSTVRHRIVWAIDPFEKEQRLLRHTSRAVRLLASQWNADVEPVYLLNDFPPNVRLVPTLIRDIEKNAQRKMASLIWGHGNRGLLPLKVITSPSSQQRSEVCELVHYAIEARADLIAVGTRARRGPRRWFLGSFAETLILGSDVPLYVVNPHEKTPRQIRHVLFPTDFSDESRDAFSQVVDFAKEIVADVTLFHRFRYDLTPAVEVASSAYPAFRAVFEEEFRAKQSTASEWIKSVESRGVQIESYVDYRTEGSVVQSILRESGSRDGIIALAAHSGPFASAFLGSATRQVVRNAECPVWVIHKHRKATPALDVTKAEMISDPIKRRAGRGRV